MVAIETIIRPLWRQVADRGPPARRIVPPGVAVLEWGKGGHFGDAVEQPRASREVTVTAGTRPTNFAEGFEQHHDDAANSTPGATEFDPPIPPKHRDVTMRTYRRDMKGTTDEHGGTPIPPTEPTVPVPNPPGPPPPGKSRFAFGFTDGYIGGVQMYNTGPLGSATRILWILRHPSPIPGDHGEIVGMYNLSVTSPPEHIFNYTTTGTLVADWPNDHVPKELKPTFPPGPPGEDRWAELDVEQITRITFEIPEMPFRRPNTEELALDAQDGIIDTTAEEFSGLHRAYMEFSLKPDNLNKPPLKQK